MLAIPSSEAAAKTSEPAAREVIRAQSADFAAYRQQLASGVTTAKTDEPGRQAKGSVQASVQDNKQTAAATPDKLKLSQESLKASAPEARVSKESAQKDSAAREAELARNVAQLKQLQSDANATKAAAAGGGAPAVAAAVPGAATAASAAAPAAIPGATGTAPGTPASAAPVAGVAPTAAAPGTAAAPTAAATTAAAAVNAPGRPAAATPEEPGMLESLFDNPLVLPGAGLLLALLAAFGIYRLRGRMRQNSGETSFLESRLQPDSFFGASGGQRIDTRDAAPVSSSAASSMSYSLSQLDAIGDVDPVAEADVYLAYGRDLQAEEILKEAMRSHPERMAIRTKLLEVYAKRRDTKGFELLAGQLFAVTSGEGEDWAKAQELGRQIDPENQLYAPGGQPDMLVREGGRLIEPLDATTLPHSVSPAVPAGPISESESLDLEPGLDLNLDFAASVPGALDATRPLTTDAVVGDASDTSPAKPAHSETLAGPLDFDLGDLSLDLGTPASADRPAAAPSMALPSLGGADEEFSLSMPDLDLGDDNADPLSRKLELAEEFRQIGDMEGARDLLEEVVANADGALKSKAQGMLDSLA
jgi:pilus assembly protein FimV